MVGQSRYEAGMFCLLLSLWGRSSRAANSRLGHFGVVFAVYVLAKRNGQYHPQQLEQV